MQKLHRKILAMGGDWIWLHPPEIGICGNTHAMMVEDDGRQIADMVCGWIKARVH